MKKPIITSLTLGSALAFGAIVANAEVNPFSATALSQGYQLASAEKASEGKAGEAKCGAEMKKEEGKCGAEGKKEEASCGASMKKTEGKSGEKKCGAEKK
jgi:uncharacterized low-complexity protein